IHLLLFLDLLDDGLNNNVAIGQVRLVGRAFEPRADRVLLLRGDPALLRRSLRNLCQRFLDPGKALVQKLLFPFEHRDRKSSRSANLRNAGPHQPATEYTNLLDVHSVSLDVSACNLPVILSKTKKPCNLVAPAERIAASLRSG